MLSKESLLLHIFVGETHISIQIQCVIHPHIICTKDLHDSSNDAALLRKVVLLLNV